MKDVVFCRNLNEDTLKNANLPYANIINYDVYFPSFGEANDFMVSNGYELVCSESYCTDELCGEITYYINREELKQYIGENFVPEDVVHDFYTENDAPCIINATVVDKDFLKLVHNNDSNGKITVDDVADYFLGCLNINSGDVISYLTLQKLCYYAQGFSLVILEKPLFEEKIYSGTNGPICDALKLKYENEFWLKKDGIHKNKSYIKKFSQKQVQLLNDVWKTYGQFSGWKLQELIWEDLAWSITRKKSSDDKKSMEISHDIMIKYFKNLVIEK